MSVSVETMVAGGEGLPGLVVRRLWVERESARLVGLRNGTRARRARRDW